MVLRTWGCRHPPPAVPAASPAQQVPHTAHPRAHTVGQIHREPWVDTRLTRDWCSLLVSITKQPCPQPRQGNELDFLTRKRRLKQTAAFTNKVTADRAGTSIINIEGLTPCVESPPCISPSTQQGNPPGAGARVSGAAGTLRTGRAAAHSRHRQGGDQGTRCLRAAPHTEVSAEGFVPVPQSQGTL